MTFLPIHTKKSTRRGRGCIRRRCILIFFSCFLCIWVTGFDRSDGPLRIGWIGLIRIQGRHRHFCAMHLLRIRRGEELLHY